VTRIILLPLLVVTSGDSSVGEDTRASSGPGRILREDATLNDVTFVDEGFGWAVGNRGLILHSRDGGGTWRAQSSGTDATLEAVHFVDRRVGYAVGGRARPDGAGCHGVVLATEDGGGHWELIGGVVTGWLHGVWADRAGRGWVLGAPTPMQPAGVWRFSASSRRFQAAVDRGVPAILAACFRPDGRGIAVGEGGACVVLSGARLGPERRTVSFEGRLAGVAMPGQRRGCMVGDDATVFVSRDSGRTWSAVRLDLPAGVRELVDLTDVAFADEDHGWAVGANGRYVLRTVDGGQTWHLCVTGLSGTLRAVHPIDARTVVGVGEAGLIGRSEDGGLTWSAVRNGRRRVGALVISTASARWAWPMMAYWVGHHRCRVAYLRVTADGTSGGGTSTGRMRDGPIRWAGNACGVTSVQALRDFEEPTVGWARPTTSPSDGRSGPVRSYVGVFRHWSRQLDRDAESAMRRQIAAAVRNLRPAVVITDEGDPDAGGDLVATSVAWLAWEAIGRAGQVEAMPEQQQIGLGPHRVQRVLAFAGSDSLPARRPRAARGSDAASRSHGRSGGESDDTSSAGIRVSFAGEFHPLLGSDSRLAGLRAAGYLGIPLDEGALAARFRVVRGGSSAERTRGLLTGIRLDAGARFPWTRMGEGSRLARLKSVADALAVAGRMAERRGEASRLVQLAARASRAFPGALAPADALYQAARQHERLGQHEAAVEVWRAFLGTGRSHPAWPTVAVRQAVIEASVERYLSLPVRPKDPLRGAHIALGRLDRLCGEDPFLAHQPCVLFARAHCLRALGQFGRARLFYRRCAGGGAAGWSAAAGSELWLLRSPVDRQDVCPRRIVTCRRSAGPVDVDGRLDEPVWRGGDGVSLMDASGRRTERNRTIVRFAWDHTYLYLAAAVPTTHGRTGPPRGHVPMRDRLDGGWPAIEWFIDVDRDAATYYRLGVDEIGNALDAHNDDLTWNLPLRATPIVGGWQYVVRHQETGWTVEMTMPMAAVFVHRPSVGQVLSIQVVRRPTTGEPSSARQWLSPQPGHEAAAEHFALLELTGDR